jgi:hypothetical protein
MKKIFVSLIALFFGLTSSAQLNALFDFQFNGNLNDQSGNNNHAIGTYVSEIGKGGDPNTAVYFNGSTDYLELPNVSMLKPQLPISLMGWVRFDSPTPTGGTFFNNDFDFDNHSGVWNSFDSQGHLAINFGDATGNTSSPNRRTKVGTTVLTAGQWYHVAFVIRSATDMDIYIDCQNDGGTYSGSGGNIAYTNGPGNLGRVDAHVSNPPYYFEGAIDNLQYYDVALTEEQISCDYQVSTSEYDSYNINLFPNPAADKINIEIVGGNLTGDEQIEVVDLQGKICAQTNDINNIYVGDLEKGVYFILIEIDGNIYRTKFIRD